MLVRILTTALKFTKQIRQRGVMNSWQLYLYQPIEASRITVTELNTPAEVFDGPNEQVQGMRIRCIRGDILKLAEACMKLPHRSELVVEIIRSRC
jgi:hypothetical protein